MGGCLTVLIGDCNYFILRPPKTARVAGRGGHARLKAGLMEGHPAPEKILEQKVRGH
jgi:hypothetical protein